MSMYTPQIKEEVSENATMLVVEEDGKVYRTKMPSSENNVLWLNDFHNTKENALMLESYFKDGKTLMYDDSIDSRPCYSKIVMCTRKYDDATSADSIVFYYYSSEGQLSASWWIID